MSNTIKLSAFILFATTISLLASCKKDKKTAEENITTVVVHLTGGGLDKEFEWNDSDGDGVANTIDTIIVPANIAGIQAHLHVYDRSATPEIDLTEEIEAESVDHLFVFGTNVGGLTISGLNSDANGAPLGISSVWASGAAGSGTVNIKLYHEPTDKNNAANPGGEVDFDITFPVVVR